jgi:large subunit ribosomal protein L17
MLRNLATSLINSRDERIVTTLPKAKELRPFVERAITLSRHAANLDEATDQKLAAFICAVRRPRSFTREILAAGLKPDVADRSCRRAPAGVAAVKRLFDEFGERFKIVRVATPELSSWTRAGDGAELAIIELLGNPREAAAEEAAKRRTKGGSKKKGSESNRKPRTSLKAKSRIVQHDKAPPGLLPIAGLLL